MTSIPVLTNVPALEIVVFQWSRQDGDCEDCGLPAAFLQPAYNAGGGLLVPEHRLCAVCAANAAADGETIERIRPAD